MDRFIFVGDVHFSSVQFGSRLDNSLETLMRKLKCVLGQAASAGESCGAYPVVVFTGDFLNGNNNSVKSLLALIDLMASYADRRECWTIGGNHELRGDDYGSLKDSQLQFLFRSRVMRFLGDGADIPCGGGGLVRGWSAYSGLDASSADRVIGLVCHHFLFSGSVDPLCADVDGLIDMFPNLKFIVSGHDHACYPIQDYRGVKIVRPGSLFRVSSAADSDRMPCFAEMAIDAGFRVAVRYVPVPALAYGDAFDLSGKGVRRAVDGRRRGIADGFIGRFAGGLEASESVEEVFSSLLSSVPEERRGLVRSDLAESGWVIS